MPSQSLINNTLTFTVSPSSNNFQNLDVETSPILGAEGVATAGEKFVYASSGNSIYAFGVNATTGVISALSNSPFAKATGSSFEGLVTGLNGSYLYVADVDAIGAYQINAADGTLTSIRGVSVPSIEFSQLAIDPSGSYLYALATRAGDGVFAFQIGLDGTLVSIPGSPFPIPGSNSVANGIVSIGSFVYVTLTTSNQVVGFSLNAQTGALSPVKGSPFPTGKQPTSIVSSQQFIYVSNRGDATLSAYLMNPSDGGLAVVPGSPFIGYGGTLAADPNHDYVYEGSSVGVFQHIIREDNGGLSLGNSVSNDGTLLLTTVRLP